MTRDLIMQDNYEKMSVLRKMFADRLLPLGYRIFNRPDSAMPEVIAEQPGHILITMIMFLDSPGVSVKGTFSYGDVSGIFYFKLCDPLNNDAEKRFTDLMDAVDTYAKQGYSGTDRKKF